MNIEIKKSIKPIKYNFAIKQMEKRLEQINKGEKKELIWILEHHDVYTGGTSFKENEIIDKSINLIKTNRGGKITYHGKGQLVFYFVINLKKRTISIRKLISSVEKTIIDTLNYFKINTFADRKNIGIWYKNKKNIKKVAAIGIKVKKWIAYHGFSLNISNDLKKYDKINPCGLDSKKMSNLYEIKKQSYKKIVNKLINNFLTNIEN
tara:strand:- start:1441 stop:2061 length:621 start_codon:yes stop_codon:yes gene_type:complete